MASTVNDLVVARLQSRLGEAIGQMDRAAVMLEELAVRASAAGVDVSDFVGAERAAEISNAQWKPESSSEE